MLNEGIVLCKAAPLCGTAELYEADSVCVVLKLHEALARYDAVFL